MPPRQALLERFLKLKGPERGAGAEQYSDPQWTGNMLHRIVERALGPICAGRCLEAHPGALRPSVLGGVATERCPPLTPEADRASTSRRSSSA